MPFIPGHYCPICLKPVPFTSQTWHPDCKPQATDPRRRTRICPGCGKRHDLPYRPGKRGNNSSFCNQECKKTYINYFDSLKDRCHYCNQKPSKLIHECPKCKKMVCSLWSCIHNTSCIPTERTLRKTYRFAERARIRGEDLTADLYLQRAADLQARM